jgi:hypothetical protein
MGKIKRFAGLPRAEQLLLLRTLFVVGLIRVGLWVLPFRVMQRFAFRARRKQETAYSVEQFVWAVRAVSRRVPGATCLTQALAAQVLLSRAGHSSRVEIGVAKGEKNQFQAHAWLVLGDRVLIGGAGLERYTPLVAWEEGH